jgi:deazaflavin-dependent oxidoreductase (nitroreductase family)
MADVSDYIRSHLKSYLETDGADGYERSVPGLGGPRVHLILKTIGRKSGAAYLTPLLFNDWGDEWVIVASKAGADDHPAWFLNLSAAKTADVQIKDKRYRCTWRIAEGDERARIWKFLVDYFPPYDSYQAATPRHIPVVMLKKTAEVEERFTLRA